jgi:hypothetical protein
MALFAGNGCRVAQQTAALPGQVVTAVVPGKKSTAPDPATLQTELLHYAADFFGRTSTGLNDYARQVNTPEGRYEALNWKLGINSSVVGIASGANPTANLVDFLALASLTRAVLEQRAPDVQPPGALDSWLESSRVLETNAWKIAEEVFATQQQTELRAAMKQWLVENSGKGSGFFRRPQGLASAMREKGEKESGSSGSVFGLVGLDPTAGLDPAVREVTRSRLFAERSSFALQQMPFLLRWQSELLTEQLLAQQQISNTLASIDRLSRAAESASQTAALLPDRVSTERKAILDSLEAQEGKLRDLSAQVGQTLTDGEKMSTSLNTTLTTFDALMKRFGVGVPSTNPPDTNSPPFNILDYAHTAGQVATMAQQLDMLIKDTSGTIDTPALDKRIASLGALAEHSKAQAKSVLNHAFLLAAGLIVLTFACALVYRRLAPRSVSVPPSSHLAEPLEKQRS